MLTRLSALGLVLLLASCATPEPEPPPPPAAAPPKAETPRIESQPLKHLVGRDLKPMPIKPLNVKTNCSFRDEVTGTRGRLDVQVKEDQVKTFTAEVNIPKRGVCRFNLKDFAQQQKVHPVTLTNSSDTCAVRMWEQGTRVTVAFAECTAKCEGDAFEYLWPILIDRKSGRCI